MPNTDPEHHESRQSAEHFDAARGDWDWDGRYSASERIWSGQPNGTLVAEVGDATPGRAIDVGCGEGADAVWLAGRGWTVTGLDVSKVATERAAQVAAEVGVHVDWVTGALLDADLPAGAFDLVSVQYPALPKAPDQRTERALLDLVAPGGMLLVVHHADFHADHGTEHGFDPADYIWPSDVRAALDTTWDVEVDERRAREVPAGGDPRHSHDLVLRARRRS